MIKLDDCDKVDASEIAKGVLSEPFFDVKACKGKPRPRQACTNKAIADYVVANQRRRRPEQADHRS